MTKRKTGFLKFIFSFLPGAGEMYMGFYKQGGSIMLTFFGIIALSSVLNFGPLVILLPVVWFYSFFHVHNLSYLPDDLFYSLEDHYIFENEDPQINKAIHSRKAKIIFAVVLIIIGLNSLWNLLTDLLSRVLPSGAGNYIYTLSYAVPQCIIALAIICIGVFLIRGKKKELDQLPDSSSDELTVVDSKEVSR